MPDCEICTAVNDEGEVDMPCASCGLDGTEGGPCRAGKQSWYNADDPLKIVLVDKMTGEIIAST